MNKLTKLMLASVMMITSGFAAGASVSIADLQDGGEIEAGGAVDIKNQILNLADGKTIDVYGAITGNGTIKCGENAKVVVHDTRYSADEDHKNTILGTTEAILGATEIAKISTVYVLDESKKGSIAEDVDVDPASALEKGILEEAGMQATDLVYIANSGGTDMKFVGGAETAVVAACAFANADANISGLSPAGLIIENKCKFSGNNSAFTGETVKIGSESAPAEVEISAANALFQTGIEVAGGSKLNITTSDEVSLSNDMTINSYTKVLKADPNVVVKKSIGKLDVTGKLVIKSGATLTLGSDCGIEKVNAEHTYDYPQVMSWPEGTFDNSMVTSDGTDGFTTGTIHDGVFSYVEDKSGTTEYKRTHDAWLGSSVLDTGYSFSYFESDVQVDSDVVLRLYIYGKSFSTNGRLCGEFYRKVSDGLMRYDDSLNYRRVYSNANNNYYTYEGNDTTGYYWKPDDHENCPDNMKTIYEGIVNGTWYKSDVAWTLEV